MKKIAALVLVLASSITSCVNSQPPPPQKPSVNVANCHLVFCQTGYHENASDCQCVPDHP